MDSFATIVAFAAPIPSEELPVPVDMETGGTTKQQGCVIA